MNTKRLKNDRFKNNRFKNNQPIMTYTEMIKQLENVYGKTKIFVEETKKRITESQERTKEIEKRIEESKRRINDEDANDNWIDEILAESREEEYEHISRLNNWWIDNLDQ